jgi:hypothetical protein
MWCTTWTGYPPPAPFSPTLALGPAVARHHCRKLPNQPIYIHSTLRADAWHTRNFKPTKPSSIGRPVRIDVRAQAEESRAEPSTSSIRDDHRERLLVLHPFAIQVTYIYVFTTFQNAPVHIRPIFSQSLPERLVHCCCREPNSGSQTFAQLKRQHGQLHQRHLSLLHLSPPQPHPILALMQTSPDQQTDHKKQQNQILDLTAHNDSQLSTA